MTMIQISIEKRRDGSVVLRIVRADGSSTWQKQEGPRARFFPHHDLTHYAVETELDVRRGFYGLIAEGWDIEDTTGKGKRGPLPDETLAVEHLVGWMDAERASERAGGEAPPASRYNDDAATYFATSKRRAALGPLDDTQIARVRATRDVLIRRWDETPPGTSLELSYPAS